MNIYYYFVVIVNDYQPLRGRSTDHQTKYIFSFEN